MDCIVVRRAAARKFQTYTVTFAYAIRSENRLFSRKIDAVLLLKVLAVCRRDVELWLGTNFSAKVWLGAVEVASEIVLQK